MKNYDAWRLDTPDYQDQDSTVKIDISVNGDIEAVKKFEAILERLAIELELDIEY